jgi:trigger factor
MNITKENIDELNAVLKLSITPEDYTEKVDTVLKDYRKKAQMPGFRKGHVPMGMIKKMYGTSVLAEELNKIINDNLYKFIEDEKLDILGNPLPNEKQDKVNIESETVFNFEYKLGLAPKFDAKLTDKDKFTFYQVKVDDAVIDKNVKDLLRRYGKVSKTDVAGDNDMLQGEFVELDKTAPKEGGIVHTSTISIEFVEDDKAKKSLVGLKVGDKINVDPKKVSKGGADTAAMLGIKKEELDSIKSTFSFEVKEIYRVEPAEMNQEIFDKLFGKDVVKSEAEFRAKIAEEIQKQIDIDCKRKLRNDVYDYFMDNIKINLPNEFLKRWLIETNQGKITTEEIEKDYEEYAKGLKFQLIQNKLVKNHDLKVGVEEIVNYAKSLIRSQMLQYGIMDIDETELNKTAQRVLENKDEVNRIAQHLIDEKLMELFDTTVSKKNKEVSYDEFVKLATEKQSKGGLFNTIKNNLKF